jgi:hypothetical protein
MGSKFLNVDEIVAIHLARNALGGADTDLRTALMLMSDSQSRVRQFRYVPFCT